MSLGINELAVKIATRRMRVEVLPIINPDRKPKSWSPLRADDTGWTDFGMKLWTRDVDVMKLLANDEMMALTQTICQESAEEAAYQNPKDFVTDALQSLIDDGRKNNRSQSS